jgi:hypothetical protein
MSLIRAQLLSGYRVPYFGGVIEGPGADSVSKWHVEVHAIYRVFMSFKGVNKIARCGVPQFAGPIVTSCDELVTIFVETAVCQGQNVAFEFFYEQKLLLLLILYFLN